MGRFSLRDARGRLRMALAAPVMLVSFFCAQYAAAWGLSALFSRLLQLWGVTNKTLPYAPDFLRTIVSCYGSLEMLLQGLAGFGAAALCALFLRKTRFSFRPGHILPGFGIGFGLSAVCFVLLRATDSVRCMAAGETSALAEGLHAAGVFAYALATEALIGGSLYSRRLRPTLAVPLYAALNCAMYVLSVPFTLPALLGALALSAACSVLYQKRSFWAAAALRGAFSLSAHRLFGFSHTGAPGIFFETFPVSRDWLTGGDLGLESGWLCAVLFAACAALLWIFLKNKNDIAEDA